MVATTSHIFSGKVDIASNLKVGSSHLFVDTENNRVGITTTDPHASLHVNGNAYIETNVGIGSTINLEGATGNVTVSGNVHATGVKVNGINVALDPDLSDNASRISVLETDMTSNAGRVTSLEELNIDDIRTDMTSNAGRIDDLFAANTVQSGLISAITLDMTSNAGRINDMFAANTVQMNLISTITLDMTSNAGRIDDLLTANTVQSDLISAITIDMTSNAGRIDDLLTANTVQRDLITDITDDMTSNAGRIDLIITDMTSNAGRIDDMFAANTVQSGLITDITLDMTSNSGRIDGLDTRIGNLETANNVQESLINTLITSNADIWSNLADNVTRITVLEDDMASNAGRITNLMTSNVDIWSNLAANVIRITNLETANTVQRDLITDITGDMTSNAGRIDVIISDVLSNALRLNQMFAANTVQGGLITAITTDMTSNAGRIDDLFAANTVQGGLITDITTDMTSNAGRIDDLFTANTVQGGLITDITTDMTSNAGRIDDLFAANTVQGGLITDITTDMTSNAGRIDDLFAANTVQSGLITDITTDMTSNAARVQYITTVADTTFIASNLEVTGNIFMRGDRFVVESETKLINDAVIGIANNNTLSTTDVGVVMQRPDANVALIHHGSGSGSYPDQFTMGYTQSTLTDGDITTDEANIFTLNVLGNVTAQNNITSTTSTVSNVTTMGTTKTFVVTMSSASGGNKYYIDGYLQASLELHQHQTYIFDLSSSTLSGHPFVFDSSNSNDGTTNSDPYYTTGITSTGVYGSTEKRTFIVPVGAPTTLYYYCTIHGGMGSTMSIASTSELIVSGRVVASGNVEASAFIGDGTKLTGVALSADMTSNVDRIEVLETSNVDIWSNLASNVDRIEALETSNVNIWSNLASNVDRIEALETSNVDIWSNLASNVDRIEALETSNVNIWSNLASNVDRIEALETSNVDIWSNLASNVVRIVALENNGIISNSSGINSIIQGDIVYASADSTLQTLAVGASGEVLKVVGGVPEWAAESGGAAGVLVSNSVGITTGFTQGDIIYASADNTLSKLALGSSGQVLKSDGTDVVWGTDGGGGSTVWLTNGNKIHYDADNVGIGTSTPAFKLDVHGTANVGALTATTLSVGGADVALDADMTANAARVDALYTGTAGQLIYGTGTDTLGKLNIGTTGHVLKVAGGVPVWAAESGGASGGGQWTGTSEIYFEGNVGISNTDPDHDLSVGSNLYVDDDGSNVLVISGNAAMSSLTLGQVSIVASYGLDDILSTSNISSNTMRLTNATTGLVTTGNVSVGNDLTVTGDMTAGYLYGDVSNVTGITSNLHQIAENGNVTSNTLQFTNATTAFTTTGNVEVGKELTVTGNVAVDTDTLFVDSVNDRVGVGKTDPATALDVVGTVTATAFTGPLTGAVTGNASTATKLAGTVNIGGVAFDGSAAIVPTTFTAATFSGDVTVDSTTFHVDSTNNRVGIGTTSPVQKLHLYDTTTEPTIAIQHLSADENNSSTNILGNLCLHRSHRSGVGNQVGIRSIRRADTWDDQADMEFYVRNGGYGEQTAMVINSGGTSATSAKVGIGKTDPATALDVLGTIRVQTGTNDATGGEFSIDTNVGHIRRKVAGNGVSLTSYDDFQFYVNATGGSAEGGTQAMIIDNSGNVGIGTTSPGTMLDIVKSGDPTLRIRDTDSDGKARIQLLESGSFTDGVPRYGTEISYDGNNNKFHISTFDGSTTKRDDLTIMRSSGNVGIGTTNPLSKLQIKPNHTSYSNPQATSGLVIYNETNSDASITHAILNLRTAGSSGGDPFISYDIYAEHGWSVGVDNSAGTQFRFGASWSNFSSTKAYISTNSTAAEIDFTGQHRSFIDTITHTDYLKYEGLIVSANKNQYFDIQEEIVTGVQAIKINESLPLVSISNVAYDKCCFGVISGSEDTNDREYSQGSFVSVLKKQEGDIRAHINSVGEGAIWVTNLNGILESGDYITTSNVAGYGQKQDDDILHNYTVAKITMDCDFNPSTQPNRIIKRELRDVNYWVKYTYDDISEEEYTRVKNLGRRVRIIESGTEISQEEYENHLKKEGYTETESNMYIRNETTHQRVFSDKEKEPKEGYELEVRNEPVNILDEHGQIQWEDHAIETEKAYKIRYLDANGVITDEANVVHTAAFVGCTYHCG